MKRLIIISLVLFACSQNQAPEAPSFPVYAANPVQKNVPVTISAIGNIYGLTSVEVRPQVTGTLMSTEVIQGQMVKKGELLFIIDPSTYQALYDRAAATLDKDKAQLELSKKRLERNQILIKKDYVAPLTAEELQAQVAINEAQIKMDEAELNQAKINLDRTKIEAFVDGKVGAFSYYPGSIVSPTDTNPMTTLEQINDVEVRFSLPQKILDELLSYYRKEDLEFDILPAKGERVIGKGQVFFVDNHIDLNTGTLQVRGVAKNTNLELWPGEFVRVRLILTVKPDAILVPQSAVQVGQQGSFIYVIKPDMTVEARPVKPQEKIDDLVVVDNVKLDEQVVIKGQINLKPGSKVTIKKDNS